MFSNREAIKHALQKYGIMILGCAILSFGLYNVHEQCHVTEGGVLGLTLLLHHWLGISPAISGLVLNIACYVAGWRTLGRPFLFFMPFLSVLIPSGRPWPGCRFLPPSSAPCLSAWGWG